MVEGADDGYQDGGARKAQAVVENLLDVLGEKKGQQEKDRNFNP
ncbi:MAG: hypothetical protein ABW185_09540 [Sedimenticola sp.]